MGDNENLNFETKALTYFGKAYLKIPRVILDKLFSNKKNERMIGKTHLLLFYICNYADGYVTLDGQLVFCRKGECITTYEALAQKLKVCGHTVKRYLEALSKSSLIEVSRIDGRLHLQVCSYEQFTAPEILPAKKSGKTVSPKQAEPPDPDTLAKRRAEEEKKISRGNKPRFDLLNQIYY